MAENRGAYLDQVLIGGREPASIIVLDYDEQWQLRFQDVAEGVRRVLGDRALGVEHIGSTAVPGLAAKPIVDMLLTVVDVTDEKAYVPPLKSIGFVLRVREPEHRMLRTPARDVHLHVHEPAHTEVQDFLDFRDWLRVNADDRKFYARTKKRLAGQRWSDMNHYADAKAAVVFEVLARARAWRARSSTPTR